MDMMISAIAGCFDPPSGWFHTTVSHRLPRLYCPQKAPGGDIDLNTLVLPPWFSSADVFVHNGRYRWGHCGRINVGDSIQVNRLVLFAVMLVVMAAISGRVLIHFFIGFGSCEPLTASVLFFRQLSGSNVGDFVCRTSVAGGTNLLFHSSSDCPG